MNKVVRDGKVAVLITNNWGAGWYSTHGIEELLFDPEIVKMLENANDTDITQEIVDYVEKKHGHDLYLGGVDNLSVVWVSEGEEFLVHEYDGYESLWYKNGLKWHTA